MNIIENQKKIIYRVTATRDKKYTIQEDFLTENEATEKMNEWIEQAKNSTNEVKIKVKKIEIENLIF